MKTFWLTTAILLCTAYHVDAQWYPKWFLNQKEVPCKEVAVGYAMVSYYTDSAVADAIRNARVNYVRQQQCTVAGGQAFWSTEAGTFWMGSNFREDFDTTAVDVAGEALKVLSTFASKSIVMALLGTSNCGGDTLLALRAGVLIDDPPAWIETLPAESGYLYAVGSAPKYFYELNSWLEAERMARRNLARSEYVEIKSLQKVDASGQEVRNEELSVTLHNVEVVERWRDESKGLMYVLVRMPK